MSGDSELVQTLLEHGADAEAPTEAGLAPLHLAAQCGSLMVVEALLAAGAQPDVQTREGLTPLMLASTLRPLSIPDAFRPRVVDEVSPGSGKVSEQRYAAICVALLGNGASVNARARNGATALLLASHAGAVAVIETLIDHGADVNAPNTLGFTPALYAAANPGAAALVMLGEAGADVDRCADDGSSCMLFAAQKGALASMEYLRRRGAAIDRPNSASWTPLLIACMEGKSEAALRLLEWGASPAQRLGPGARIFCASALHIAAQNGLDDVAARLLALRPELVLAQLEEPEGAPAAAEIDSIRCVRGDTPLVTAAANGKKTFAVLLDFIKELAERDAEFWRWQLERSFAVALRSGHPDVAHRLFKNPLWQALGLDNPYPKYSEASAGLRRAAQFQQQERQQRQEQQQERDGDAHGHAHGSGASSDDGGDSDAPPADASERADER